MSQVVVQTETTEVQYLKKLRIHVKDYISNLVEEKIILNQAREVTKEERAKRRELLKKKDELLESEKFDINEFRSILSEIGKYNKIIAEKEKPYREKASPYRENKNRAFNEIVTTMIFNGDLELSKALKAGLVKLK